MTNLSVINIAGLAEFEADLALGGVYWVGGGNGVGKSSLAMVLGGLLTRNPNPLNLAGTTSIAKYRRGGTRDAFAVLTTNGGEVIWRVGGEVETTDKPWSAHPISAGLAKPFGLAPKQNKELWQSIVGFHYGEDDLIRDFVTAITGNEWNVAECREYLEQDEIGADLKVAISTVLEQGWKAAESLYADRGRDHKSKWGIAVASAGESQTWGSNIGARWRPSGWHSDLDGKTVRDADNAVSEARDNLKILEQTLVLSQAAEEKLQADKERLAELKASEPPLPDKVQLEADEKILKVATEKAHEHIANDKALKAIDAHIDEAEGDTANFGIDSTEDIRHLKQVIQFQERQGHALKDLLDKMDLELGISRGGREGERPAPPKAATQEAEKPPAADLPAPPKPKIYRTTCPKCKHNYRVKI